MLPCRQRSCPKTLQEVRHIKTLPKTGERIEVLEKIQVEICSDKFKRHFRTLSGHCHVANDHNRICLLLFDPCQTEIRGLPYSVHPSILHCSIRSGICYPLCSSQRRRNIEWYDPPPWQR